MLPLSSARFLSLGLYTAAFIGLLDQLSKGYVLDLLHNPPHMRSLTSFLNIVRVWNKGMTFGLGATGDPRGSLVLATLAFVVLVFLLRWLMRAQRLLPAFALGLIMGGAVGNIIDRLRFGAVFDFIDFHLGGWHWYAFNVADSAIVVGVGLLILDNLRMRKG